MLVREYHQRRNETQSKTGCHPKHDLARTKYQFLSILAHPGFSVLLATEFPKVRSKIATSHGNLSPVFFETGRVQFGLRRIELSDRVLAPPGTYPGLIRSKINYFREIGTYSSPREFEHATTLLGSVAN
jgi:hypothetical protein